MNIAPRTKRVAILGLVGAIIGGLTAYIGASFVFACPEPRSDTYGGVHTVLCGEASPLLALLWGVPIGTALALVVALVMFRRRPETSV